jgi:hypothetical protein
VSLSLHAQVNQDELEQNQAPVSFINYEGPHARIETRDQIRGIGYALGQAIREGTGRAGTRDRYFAIHVTGPAEDGRLDADIFGLGYDTGVDHIRNLRLIIQGYLEGAYGYSVRDAALLAEYTTVYNAVYRGDWEYVSSRYKTPVIAELNQDQTGLSIRFDEWPGQSLLLIPLGTGSFNSLSAVETSAVADRQVVEELRQDEDRGIEPRRDMVDLKEREADEAEQQAQELRQEAGREQERIDQERQQIGQERQQIAQERQAGAGQERDQRPPQEQGRGQAETPAPRQAEGQGGAGPAEPAAAGREAPAAQDAQEAELDRREEDLNRRQEAVDEMREEARRNEERAEQKREEAREEREHIAQDQQTLINQEPQRETGRSLIGAVIEARDSSLGRFVRISPETREELGRSAVNTVNTRTIYRVDGRLFAIAGENRGSGAIRLIEADPQTLEMKTQGDDDIHPQSQLWVNGTDLYAIIAADGAAYLGRFDLRLALQARSTEALHPFATLLFQDGQLLTQRQDGSALILNPQTLAGR